MKTIDRSLSPNVECIEAKPVVATITSTEQISRKVQGRNTKKFVTGNMATEIHMKTSEARSSTSNIECTEKKPPSTLFASSAELNCEVERRDISETRELSEEEYTPEERVIAVLTVFFRANKKISEKWIDAVADALRQRRNVSFEKTESDRIYAKIALEAVKIVKELGGGEDEMRFAVVAIISWYSSGEFRNMIKEEHVKSIAEKAATSAVNFVSATHARHDSVSRRSSHVKSKSKASSSKIKPHQDESVRSCSSTLSDSITLDSLELTTDASYSSSKTTGSPTARSILKKTVSFQRHPSVASVHTVKSASSFDSIINRGVGNWNETMTECITYGFAEILEGVGSSMIGSAQKIAKRVENRIIDGYITQQGAESYDIECVEVKWKPWVSHEVDAIEAILRVKNYYYTIESKNKVFELEYPSGKIRAKLRVHYGTKKESSVHVLTPIRVSC